MKGCDVVGDVRDYEESRRLSLQKKVQTAINIIRYHTRSLPLGETMDVELPITTPYQRDIEEFIDGVREEISLSGDLLCVGYETSPFPYCTFMIKRVSDNIIHDEKV